MIVPIPILKIALVPALIAGVTLVGRRFGPGLAGTFASFPIVGGPILLFLTLERGTAFGAETARGVLLGTPAFVAFCLAYARVSRRAGWLASLTAGLAAFFAGVGLLSLLSVPLAGAAGLAVASTIAAPWFFPPPSPLTPAGSLPRSEILVRMAAAAALVAAITAVAGTVGARWSGLLTPFPVATSVLAVFSQRAQGRAFTGRLLQGTILGLHAYIVFFIILALSLEGIGTGPAFLCAFAGALAAQGLSFAILPRILDPGLPRASADPTLPSP
ncbi:MAG: hypothetical protein AAB215_02650 [Planctomycetota bacterium]